MPKEGLPLWPRGRAGFAPWMAALFLAAAAIYLWSLPPEFLFDDNPEFISAAHVLGVCHPPGYPLFSLAGKLFSAVTPGAVALGVNFLSAVAGALGVALLARALFMLTGRLPVSVVFAGFFMLSRTFWSQSAEAEVYAPNIFFTAALFNLVLDAEGLRDKRLILAAAAVGGLAVLNHYTALVVLPIVAAYAVYTHRKDLTPAAVAACAALFLLSLAALVYLPLRSAASPEVSWGAPHTISGFLRHVKGVETMARAARVPLVEKWKFVADYARLVLAQCPWPCLLLLIPGVVALWRGRRRGALIAALYAASIFVFILSLNYLYGPRGSYVVSFFYITSFFMMFIVIGLGAAALFDLAPGNGSAGLEKWVLLIPATLISWHTAHTMRYDDRHENRIAPDYGRNILMTADRDAALFSFDVTESFPLSALRSVYGMRRDLTLYGKPGDPLGGGDENLKGAKPGSVAENRGQDPRTAMLAEAAMSRKVFMTIGAIMRDPGMSPVVDGLLYRVRVTGAAPDKRLPPSRWDRYSLAGVSIDSPDCAAGDYDYLTCYVVSKYYLLRAADHLQRERPTEADSILRRLVTFNPKSQFLRLSLATIYLHTGRIEDALDQYEAAAKLPPEEVESSLTGFSIYNNAGELYRYKKEWNSAIAAFKKARDIAPDDFVSHFQLGRAHSEYAEYLFSTRRNDEAQDNCRGAVAELEKAAGMGGGSDSVYTGIAWCYEMLGDDVKASKYYRLAVKEGETSKPAPGLPKYTLNYFRAGEFYASRMRQFPRAADALEKFLDKTPDAPEADAVRIKLAFIYCHMKEYAKALAHLRGVAPRIEKLTPYQKSALFYYSAIAYRGTRQNEKALLMMINGISDEADLPEMHRDFARYLYNWGETPAPEAIRLEKDTAIVRGTVAGRGDENMVKLNTYVKNLIENRTRYAIAIDEFQKYLDKTPGAWDAADVNKMIEDLKSRFAQ